MPHCPKCGRGVPEDANFCYSCGYNLKQPISPSHSALKNEVKSKELEEDIEEIKRYVIMFIEIGIKNLTIMTEMADKLKANLEELTKNVNALKELGKDNYKILSSTELTELVNELNAKYVTLSNAVIELGGVIMTIRENRKKT